MLKAYSSDTLFEFIPSDEREEQKKFEKENPGKSYNPFKVLFIQMDNNLLNFYRTKMNDLLEQTQEVSGRGRDAKTLLKTTADMQALRELDIKIGKAIIKKATNFEIVEEHTAYPIMEGGKVKTEWCTDEKELEKVINFMERYDWLSDLIQASRTRSELTVYEKKS